MYHKGICSPLLCTIITHSGGDGVVVLWWWWWQE